MKAINPKNQKKVDKTMKCLKLYNEANKQREHADNFGENSKVMSKLNNKCALLFDKYLDCLNELPKNQQIAIEKSDEYQFG